MKSISSITVRYAETDKMGIVHHSVYPIWYEIARSDFVKKLGMSYSQMEEMGIMTPLIALSCHYRKPASYEDELEVIAYLKNLTPVKLEFYYEIYYQATQTLLNTGSTIHAIVGENRKPINLKKQYPAIYQQLNSSIEE